MPHPDFLKNLSPLCFSASLLSATRLRKPRGQYIIITGICLTPVLRSTQVERSEIPPKAMHLLREEKIAESNFEGAK